MAIELAVAYVSLAAQFTRTALWTEGSVLWLHAPVGSVIGNESAESAQFLASRCRLMRSLQCLFNDGDWPSDE